MTDNRFPRFSAPVTAVFHSADLLRPMVQNGTREPLGTQRVVVFRLSNVVARSASVRR